MTSVPKEPGRHTLILPPNWLGDVVMAQPAMQAIAHYHRQDHLMIHGRPWLSDLLPYLNLGDCTFETNHPTADRTYLFPNSFGSAWRAIKAGCRERTGYRGQWRRILLSHSLPRRLDLKHEHHRLYYLDIPTQLHIPIAEQEVRLSCPAGDREAGRDLMAAHGLDPDQAICVAPGAQFGGAKRYPAESYAQILSKLAKDGWQPIVLGVETERTISDEVLSKVEGPAWNAAGQTRLREALQLVSACRLMLCNDSGFMHVAAGLGIPTVAIFGATDPARTSPSGPRVHVLYEPAACSPCLQRECTVKGQPCMANVLPEVVRDTCLTMLAT